ncbi:YbaB/EbfC family DNA-binding protein [Amycolatopsis sp. EV170708-02-1]|uniref:YbaB/EbfC family DNA-binding protein n=1 Tax=Amycolatopsis sp. EV170708-02-1 TaxID=2919322 RepID=UPI001F0C1F16|nr:YbaB/EbfC family DNA-binding protein [Amycolatopsis sp. EV170708-02-1]UMP06959.1 YbaB/EbfC family DNA-binding protein [Amycolatopsis sp. EV170708-02-1]
MTSGGFDLDKGLDEAMATLDAERRKLAELGKVWEEGRTTVRAKDKSFEMTFDGRGELIEMVFNQSKYRTLAPAQLAAAIVETLQRGKAETMAKMTEVMGTGAGTLPGIDIDAIASGKIDPMEMLNSLIGPMFDGIGGVDGFGSGTEKGRSDGGGRKDD